jgi:serine/threonine protein kinase
VIAPELSHDHEFRERFQREFRAPAQVQHANVIPVYHAGEHDGLLYVTMRYVDGTDLARLLHSEGRLEPAVAAHLVAQVGNALDAAHKAGIVHRDVKPANVLIELDGDDMHALLTDFGLMKNLRSTTQITQHPPRSRPRSRSRPAAGSSSAARRFWTRSQPGTPTRKPASAGSSCSPASRGSAGPYSTAATTPSRSSRTSRSSPRSTTSSPTASTCTCRRSSRSS